MKKFIITEEEKKHILSLYNLVEDFKTQKKKFIEQGYDEFIVDKYLKDFRDIKDRKYKEAENVEMSSLNVPKGIDRFNIDNYKTFKELEMLVDYVLGQRNVGSANFTEIKVDGKPIFENNDVEIYYAPNQQSCIEYKGDKPYSWCISKIGPKNMYTRYRMGREEPSFYFVKRKKAMEKEFSKWNSEEFNGEFSDKWHFFVIQVLNKTKKNGYITNPGQPYIITSANNDGDITTNWDGVLKVAPELDGLKEYFKNIPLIDMEREKYETFKKGVSDEEFLKLPYNEKKFYLDVIDGKISDVKFNSLPNDLKDKYINLGFDLSDDQLNSIKNEPKLVKRFQEVSNDVYNNVIENAGQMFANPSYSLIGKNQYELLNDDSKKNLLNIYKNDINKFIRNWLGSDTILKKIINDINDGIDEYSYDMLGSWIPSTFFLSITMDRDEFMKKISNNKNALFILTCCILFYKSKEELKNFLNYMGTSFEEVVKTLDGYQYNILQKIESFKSS